MSAADDMDSPRERDRTDSFTRVRSKTEAGALSNILQAAVDACSEKVGRRPKVPQSMCGYIVKQGWVYTNWKKRYMELAGDKLRYSEKQSVGLSLCVSLCRCRFSLQFPPCVSLCLCFQFTVTDSALLVNPAG